MYEIIDEALKLASCGITDLTYEQASSFLSQWEGGKKLGSLTLFFDPKTNYLVINKDNPNYEVYLELARGYLNASEEEKEVYREKFGRRHQETFRVMDNFRVHIRIQNDLEIIEHQNLAAPSNKVTKSVLLCLEEKEIPTHFLMSRAYSYGVMNGKRMERARRKAGATVRKTNANSKKLSAP